MATIYVSALRGNDSTGNGTAATPYATADKAAGASGVAAAGDVVAFEGGNTFRELLTLGVQGTSGNPITFVGDGDGSLFYAGGYTTPRTGLVKFTGWTNNTTPMTSGYNISAASKSYVTWKNIKFVAPHGAFVYACLNVTGTWSNWTFEKCTFVESATRQILCGLVSSTAQALNVVFRQCRFATRPSNNTIYGVEIIAPAAASEYNANVLFENCRFRGSAGAVRIRDVGGSGSAYFTGVRAQQCGFIGCYRGFFVNTAKANTAPHEVYGCRFRHCNGGIEATTSGQIVEDGNTFTCGTNLTNVTAGTHSIATSEPNYSDNDELLYGGRLRPWCELGEGAVEFGAGAYGTPPTVDINGNPRPAGGKSTAVAIGEMERTDAGVKDTTYMDSGSPACMMIEGPGYTERPVLVKAGAARTISVKSRHDGNHGDTNKPRLSLLQNAEIGYAGEVKTSSATAGSGATPGSYATTTFASFTPTADGVVILRMENRAAASNGKCYFDTISIS